MAVRMRWVVLAALALGASATQAHEFSPGFLGFTELEADVYRVQWKVSLTGGLAEGLLPQLPDECTFTGELSAYVMGDARVQQRDVRCDGGLAGRTVSIDGLPSTMTDVLVRIDYLDGGSVTHLLTPAAPGVVIAEAQGALAVVVTYVVLGTEHILIGIDHLLFVLALLLLVNGVRRLIITVTAFTLAHSITLGAATLGLVDVPQAPVEAVIALSILFLAAELGRKAVGYGDSHDIALEFPWVVAFLFGLLHGFGFAGALADVGLPPQAVPLALLFFNVGVEIGQLIFIFAVLGLAWAWRRVRLPAPPVWRVAAAYGMGSVAAFWVFDRTIGAI
ncbi:MAG: HupE/UreJ family protein [Gammaproteobacteria bacterium]|nr:HupE/UreJ family protein [Gammaproteobacteria bacterium]MDH3507773.1 HupE/UreJ family protein [Gammaproteobacteria bacterium]